MAPVQSRNHYSVSSSNPKRRTSPWLALALLAASCTTLPACSSAEPRANAPATARVSEEQALVERSALALAELRKNPRFKAMDAYLGKARGVLIFPKLVKASLLVGGEGGSGVLVARKPDGSWSGPAFYSLGSPSVGLQAGYQEAAVVLFIMNDITLGRTMSTNVALGAKAGASLGDIDDHGKTSGSVFSADVYQVIDAEGAFVGVSLDGYVIRPRSQLNAYYYGKSISPLEILTTTVQSPDTLVLERALEPRAAGKTAAIAANR